MKKLLKLITTTLLIFSTMVLFGEPTEQATMKDVLIHWSIWGGVIAVLCLILWKCKLTSQI